MLPVSPLAKHNGKGNQMRSTFVGLSFCCLFSLIGCSNSKVEPSADSGPKKLRIAVIPKGTSHSFWKSIHAGAVKAEKEFGDVTVLWKGPPAEDNRTEQINIIDNFVTNQVDGIVLAPLDRTAVVKPVDMAMAKKIPVVIVDSGLDSENITSYISTDNYNGGKVAAEYMGKLLGGKGNVIVLRYQVGSESTEQREKGFLDTIAKDFPDIKVISSEQYAGATQPSALAQAENLLTRFKGEVNGWFCPCEPVTAGTAQAVKNAGLGGQIKIVGFDSGPDVMVAMREGIVHGLVMQDPINMGYLGVKNARAAIKGETVEKRVSTGEFLVTPENMNEERSKELHSPDLAKWLGE
jgi:ribose transport system substrate-binding protein